MADIFGKEDIRKLFRGKKVLFVGDSIMRNIYQDFIFMIEKGDLTPQSLLRKKGKQIPSFEGDQLVKDTGELTPGRNFREIREYGISTDGQFEMFAAFYFSPRCYSTELDDYIHEYKRKHVPPDLILVLSALWDINRWGPSGISDYRNNCKRLLSFVYHIFPADTQLIWLTSPPISVEIWGGLLVKGMEFTERSMRFNVMEGNLMVAHTAAAYGFDVIDLHYWLSHMIYKRLNDGIHWSSSGVRLQVNIILTHYCLSRNLPLPGRCEVGRSLSSARIIAEAADLGAGGDIVKDDHVASSTRRDMIVNCNTSEGATDKCVVVKEVADVDSSPLCEPSKKRIRFDKGSMNSPNVQSNPSKQNSNSSSRSKKKKKSRTKKKEGQERDLSTADFPVDLRETLKRRSLEKASNKDFGSSKGDVVNNSSKTDGSYHPHSGHCQRWDDRGDRDLSKYNGSRTVRWSGK